MSDLENILNQNQAPAPRASLSSRILAAAETAEPANDVQPSRPWWAVAGVAAMAVMAALFVMQPLSGTDVADPNATDSDPSIVEMAEADVDWDQIADASGFSDLYLWVEGDDSSAPPTAQ